MKGGPGSTTTDFLPTPRGWEGSPPWTRSGTRRTGTAYCGNDPVNYVDPWGLSSEEIGSDGEVDEEYQPNIDLVFEGLYNLGGAIIQGSFGVGLTSVPTGATQVVGALVIVDAVADGVLAIGQITEGLMGVEDGQVPSDLLGEVTTKITGNEEAGNIVEYVTDKIPEKYGGY